MQHLRVLFAQTILQRQQAVAPASTLRPTRSAGADGEPALVRKRSLSNGSANKMLQMSVVAAPAAVDSDDVLIDAKRILNDAMNADRAKQYETALALYENGLDELMRLIKVSNDQQQRQWITEQIRRHLTRAETVKKLIVEEKERRAPLTGVRALEIADIAWDEGRYEQALGHYEKALALLRQTPPTDATSDQLVHCSERIELLNARATHGGRFERCVFLCVSKRRSVIRLDVRCRSSITLGLFRWAIDPGKNTSIQSLHQRNGSFCVHVCVYLSTCLFRDFDVRVVSCAGKSLKTKQSKLQRKWQTKSMIY